jgi:hypothetical protein
MKVHQCLSLLCHTAFFLQQSVAYVLYKALFSHISEKYDHIILYTVQKILSPNYFKAFRYLDSVSNVSLYILRAFRVKIFLSGGARTASIALETVSKLTGASYTQF